MELKYSGFECFRDPIFVGFSKFFQSSDHNLFTATWVNHFSLKVLWVNSIDLNAVDLVGVDGKFLDILLGRSSQRSSADLVLPEILSRYHLKIGIFGGDSNSLEDKANQLTRIFPGTQVVLSIDGYSELEEEKFFSLVRDSKVDLMIIAAGSPKQEEILRLFYKRKEFLATKIAVITCGGWLDQILYEKYYPDWAYTLRLNWLVRVVRDPKRLWKRYLIVPFQFLSKRTAILGYFKIVPGYKKFHLEQTILSKP